jgi:hypothetical protein
MAAVSSFRLGFGDSKGTGRGVLSICVGRTERGATLIETEPDYSACSLDELRDVARHINRVEFPDRATRVDAEIAARTRSQNATSQSVRNSSTRFPRWLKIVFAGVAAAMLLMVGIPMFIALGINSIADRRSELRGRVKAYAGDGAIDRMVRRYAPGVASEGYIVELPRFSLSKSSNTTYSLSGLPTPDSTAYVEIYTYLPHERASRTDLEKLAPPIPSSHRIRAVLFHRNSGQIITQRDAAVAELDRTHVFDVMPASFIRNLFDVPLKQIGDTSDLALTVKYDIGNQSVQSEGAVAINVPAPTL